jgi:hypothetical protein
MIYEKEIKGEIINIEVGMGATKSVGSDSYPYTIIKVTSNGNEIHAQRDNSTPTEDSEYYGTQSYTYIQDPNSEVEIFTLRKNGYFVKKGRPLNHYWDSLSLGIRRYYRDPSF